MSKYYLSLFLSLTQLLAVAQFAPPVGQPGTTAIYKDSSVFVGWATGCSVIRGYLDISNTALGYATVGDSSMAEGVAGSNGVVSLGDGGYAIATFENPISNGQGWDFAVFENSFSDDFLELAYVEVSSDGINYFRFPCTSYTQDSIQIEGFGTIDAIKIDNLAGKYRAMYGTPFDLDELSSQAGLNVNAITHVKIIDVVGCIKSSFARYDQYGNIINDPWSNPFASCGFDLDAVGVIHSASQGMNDLSSAINFNIYPNPAKELFYIQINLAKQDNTKIVITDCKGVEIKTISSVQNNGWQTIQLDVSEWNRGVYFISIFTKKRLETKKLVITHDEKK